MSTEARVDALQNQVSELQVTNARLSVTVEHLANTVAKLEKSVEKLTTVMNQGKGAYRTLFAIISVSTAIGTAINYAIGRLLH